MEPLSAHAAAATGDLRSAPLAHLLIELLEAQATGTLFVHGLLDELVALVRIETGVPVRMAATAVEASRARSPRGASSSARTRMRARPGSRA
jgi:hypothetical protein